jgi:hypothetical protein
MSRVSAGDCVIKKIGVKSAAETGFGLSDGEYGRRTARAIGLVSFGTVVLIVLAHLIAHPSSLDLAILAVRG